MSPLLRASNDAHNSLGLPFPLFISQERRLLPVSLRPSSEHIQIVRAPGARDRQ